MRHGSLFSGGGGFDLAAESVGWQNVFHCERDPFCQTILKHYWPETTLYPDIKEFNAREYKGKIDVITGGFPCQPFSSAGKRRGTDDDRYLWPDMLRIIREVQPRWVVGENVFGLINWNGGLVLQQVQSDLEAEGFQVWPYVLPAAGLNAPHQRYRVFIVAFHPEHAAAGAAEDNSNAHRTGRFGTEPRGEAAQGRERGKYHNVSGVRKAELEEAYSNANGDGCNECNCEHEKQPDQAGQYAQCDSMSLGKDVADTNSQRPQLEAGDRELAWQRPRIAGSKTSWADWPTQSPLCGGDDGLPAQLDGITFPKWRVNSLKMYGNAVVPQVAAQIFAAIADYEQTLLNKQPRESKC